jgi:DNA modification methylase
MAGSMADALLGLTNRGDVVIDPSLGSSSTLIAAHSTRRVCRGVELHPDHPALALNSQ